MSGRVEVDFEFTPERVAQQADDASTEGRGLGLLLELAAHAVSTALPGLGIEDLRFGTMLRMDSPRRYRATVDSSSRRIVISSVPLGSAAVREVTHLSGRAERLGAKLPDRLGLLAPQSPASARIAADDVLNQWVAAELGGKAPSFLDRITLHSHGVDADLALPDDGWSAYRVHPLIVEGAWLLARLWFSRRWPATSSGIAPALRGGAMSIRPVSAEAFHVLEPGARADRLRLLALPGPGESSIVLLAERRHEVTCFVHALTVSPVPEIASLDAAASGALRGGAMSVGGIAPALRGGAMSVLGPRSRGELASELKSRLPQGRRDFCEQYVSRIIRAALGRPVPGAAGHGVPRDVPFRDLGLASAQATAVAAALAEALDRPMAATLLFDHPTVETLAGAVVDAAFASVRSSAGGTRRGVGRPLAVAEPIAVIGMGCRLPGGIRSPDEYWRALSRGMDAVGPVPRARIDLVQEFQRVRHALGALEDIEQFDARFFGISSREAAAMDPQQRLLLEVTWQALEDAGLVPASLLDSRTGVFVGLAKPEYSALVGDPDAYTVVGNAPSVAVGRLSYFFGFRGPNLCVDTACSSSLVAVALACESLHREESELAIAGGVNLTLDPKSTEGLAAAGVLSPTGQCRTFDDAADGYVRGEGCGIVVLRRLSDAVARGDRVLAVVRGHAINHGGRGNGLAAPNKAAQVELIRRALERADIQPSEVGYVEAHGTGTIIGDAVELQALSETYGAASGRAGRVWIGSAKTNIGHLEAAAGVAGFIKAVLVLRHHHIPQHLHVERPLSEFDWEAGAIAIPAEPQPFPLEHGRRLVAVNSFGMSGTNAHAILEEPAQESPPTRRPPRDEPCLIVVSGRSDASVRALCADYADYLDRGSDPFDLAHTAGQHRQHMELRAAVVGTGPRELADKLRAAATGPHAARVAHNARPKVAFLFSGQGTQYAGMGRALYEREPVFRHAIAACDEIVAAALGRSLSSVLYGSEADPSELQRTSIAQPALFAFEYALTRLWSSWGIEPDYVMGHSLGEYAAAHAAGVFDLRDALELMYARGCLMESLASHGAMAALSLSDIEAEEALHPFGGRVTIAALNGPQQVVVSGAAELVDRLCSDLAARGVGVQRLEVAYGFHSELVDPILDRLEALTAGVRMQPPQRKLISNLTGRLADAEVCSAQYWRNHSRMPVRYFDGLQTLRAEGVNVFVEIGPQPVLLGLAAVSMPARAECLWLPSIRKHGDGHMQMLRSAAQLYLAGRDLAFQNVPGSRVGRASSAPLYRFDGRKYWATAEEPAPVVESATGVDWHYALGWKAQHIPSQGTRAANWLIVGRNHALGGTAPALRGGAVSMPDALKTQLEQYGASVTYADSESSIEAQLRGEGAPEGVIYLADVPLRDGASDGNRLLDATVAACMQTAGIVRALVRCASRTRLWIVTRGGQQVDTEDVDVVGGAIWSLGRAIGVEHPEIWGGLIDLEPVFRPEDLDLLCRSVLWSDGENQIALRGGHRFVARLRRMHVAKSSGARALSSELTYVVTGGLGHIGLHVARFLVSCGARHLVLIGRHGLSSHDPDGGVGNQLLRCQHMLQELRQQGAAVRIVELDVCDRDGLRRLLHEAEPKVGAVFHAAGTNDHQPIIELDEARLRSVLRSKIAGSWALHELTQGEHRPQFVLFSSFVATLAPVGRSAYGVANGFLDALACHRRHLGLHALSIGWGLWGGDGGMAVSERALEVVTGAGVSAMEPARALDALGRALDAGSGCRVVADVAWDRYRSIYGLLGHHPILDDLSTAADAQSAGAERTDFLQQLSSMTELERVQELCSRLQSELSRVVVADDLDLDRSFGEFGLDSLGVLQLRSRINSLLGLTVSPMVVVENPSIRRLAQALSSELGSDR